MFWLIMLIVIGLWFIYIGFFQFRNEGYYQKIKFIILGPPIVIIGLVCLIKYLLKIM